MLRPKMGQSSMIPQIYGSEAYQTAYEMCKKAGEMEGKCWMGNQNKEIHIRSPMQNLQVLLSD